MQVGVNTYADVVTAFGPPQEKISYSNNVKYIYSDFHVSIQDETAKINTITIFDKNYIDLNGIRIGTSKSQLQATLKRKITRKYVTDRKRGIVYWISQNKVKKIVLVHQLAFD